VRPILRNYEPADLEALWRIDQACFEPGIAYSRRDLEAYIGRRNTLTVVAEDASEMPSIVGFLVVYAGSKTGHLITIDVLEAARRSGVGSQMLGAAETWLRERGCTGVALETAVNNIAAIHFYKRHGFELVGTVPHYYRNGLDAFVLRKDLRQSPGRG
jgi:ribosomal-protein-alanine N-acetyltransferase